MRVYFLGTNGWYDTKTGNTVCVLVETENEYIIFDAGNGFYKIDQYIKEDKPIYLFLSHYHLDHVIGFHALVKFKFKQGIDIYGPFGLNKFFKDVITYPYSVSISRLKMRVKLHEIKARSMLPLGAKFKALRHASTCYGYRIFSEGKSVTYCTDTGTCRNLFLLAKGADLLITECSFKEGQGNNKWPHLNPEQAAKIASSAKCKKLALLHFDASLYLNKADRKIALAVAKKTFSNTLATEDGLVINL